MATDSDFEMLFIDRQVTIWGGLTRLKRTLNLKYGWVMMEGRREPALYAACFFI